MCFQFGTRRCVEESIILLLVYTNVYYQIVYTNIQSTDFHGLGGTQSKTAALAGAALPQEKKKARRAVVEAREDVVGREVFVRRLDLGGGAECRAQCSQMRCTKSLPNLARVAKTLTNFAQLSRVSLNC